MSYFTDAGEYINKAHINIQKPEESVEQGTRRQKLPKLFRAALVPAIAAVLLCTGCVTNRADIENGVYYPASAVKGAAGSETGDLSPSDGSQNDLYADLSDEEIMALNSGGPGSGIESANPNAGGPGAYTESMNGSSGGPGSAYDGDGISVAEWYGLTDEEIENMTWMEYLRLPLRDLHIIDDKTLEYRGHKYKKKSYVKTVLALGIDTHDDLHMEKAPIDRNLSDGIFLIAHDTARNQMKVLMIPRDSMLECDIFNEETDIVKGRALLHITQAYSERKTPEGGCESAKKAVEELLPGVSVDHTAAVSLNIIADITDAVDGVNVTVPNDILARRVPEWTMGKNITLTGETAETFLRFRRTSDEIEDYGPIIRMAQHRQYLLGFNDAMRKKSKTDSNIVLELYDIVVKNMVTDMFKDDILKLGMDGITSSFSTDDIITVPSMEEPSEFTLVYTDYERTIPILLDLFYREVS